MDLRVGMVGSAAGVTAVLLAGAAFGCGARPSTPASHELVYDVGTGNGSARAGLFVVDDEGKNRRRLTRTPPSSVEFAQWSPQGGTILFESAAGYDAEFWVVQADGSGLRQVGYGSGAIWSPDGSEIAVLASNEKIEIVDRNGEQRRAIRLGLSRGQYPDVGSAWSPDGAEIAINILDDNGDGRLALVAAEGSGPARFLGKPVPGVSEESAAWSPDSKAIAFIRVHEDASNGNEIWVVRPDGSGRRRITDGADDVTWSKDGESLLFDASYPRSPGRYSVPVSGGEAHRIGPVPPDGAAPGHRREPGGDRVLQYEKDGGLAVARLDGSGKKVLTKPYEDDAPRWSPDGRRIAFTRGSEERGSWDVHLIDASGRRDRRVCQGGSPVWLPDGRLLIERKQGFALADTDPERVAVPVEGRTPMISPDGMSIAFVRDRKIFVAPSTPKEGNGYFQEVQSTLFVQGWSGDPRALAKTREPGPQEIVYDAHVWAPDGQSILIEERDPLGGSLRILQIPVGGGKAKTVVSNLDLEFLAVAPDGKRIAFTSDRGIEVLELDDGDRKTIVPGYAGFALGLEWAPDGKRLAYVVDNAENESVFELYVVDADGSHRRRVSQPGDAVGAFDWRPQAPHE